MGIHFATEWGASALGSCRHYSLTLYQRRKPSNLSPIVKAFLDSMCLWFLLATPLLFSSSGDPTYLYVTGMPSAVFGAFILVSLRPALLTAFRGYAVSTATFYPRTTFSRSSRPKAPRPCCSVLSDRATARFVERGQKTYGDWGSARYPERRAWCRCQ